MNICLMNDAFPPIIDGVSTTIINYAQIIQQQFGQAVVVTPRYPNVTDAYSFPVLRYGSINTTKLVGYRTGYPFSLPAIHKLKAQNIDIIHAHCPFISLIFARTLRESLNVPIVFTYHTKFDIDIANALNLKSLQQTAIKILVNNIEMCDEVWVVSQGAGKNLQSLGYRGDYLVMENGVDFPRGPATEQEVAALRAAHRLPEALPVFLFVGRLRWYKGIRLILDGLRQLQASGQAFRMVFVGDGSDREEINTYVRQLGLEKECVFVGTVYDRETLRAYYSLADLFLFPSTFDTNGLVVREAAACGTPSLLLRESNAAEGITDGQNGILIDEDTQAMFAALTLACAYRGRLREMGRQAMHEIYLSWDDAVAKACARYSVVVDNYHQAGGRRTPLKHNEFTQRLPHKRATPPAPAWQAKTDRETQAANDFRNQ